MEVKLGDLAALQRLRDSLIRDDVSEERGRKRLDQERWSAFKRTAQGIIEAVDDQSLSGLVSSVRRMKNLLRRPSVKRDLAQMEAGGVSGKEDEKPEGSCACAQCGKTIDGYNDCIKGALCVDCAMKERDVPPGEKAKEKDEKQAKKGTAFPPEMIAPNMQQQGEPQDQAVTNAPVTPVPEDPQQDDEDPEEPKQRSKLRKKGFKPQKESDEISVPIRRKGLRRRDYEKWQL